MPTTQEIIKLDVIGAQGLQKLKESLNAYNQTLFNLTKSTLAYDDANKAMTASFTSLSKDGVKLKTVLYNLNGTMWELSHTTSDVVHANQALGASQAKLAQQRRAWDAAVQGSIQADQQLKSSLASSAQTFDKHTGTVARSQQVLLSWQSVVRLVIVQLLHRAFAEVAQRIGDATTSAQEFYIRIAEIQTISQRNQLTVDQWAEGLLKLSSAFGTDILDTTKGAYETLSNQVAEGAGAFSFMREEMKLSVTAVASVRDSIDATTAVINSFNLATTESARINAVLFKTVDLGRTTLEEMSGDLGRISVLSAQLGIRFEEQQAALSTLTIQGLKHNIAQTFLYNVFLKLIKPTEKMNTIFAKWGVTSGQAAIQTYGLFGVLRKLAEEAENSGDAMEEMGEQWGRIRALTGAVGLSKNFEGLEQNWRDMANAGEESAKALTLVMENQGKQVQIQLQQVRNYFTETFGIGVIKSITKFTEAYGSLTDVVKLVLRVIKDGAIVWAGYKLTLLGIRVATNAVKWATLQYEVTMYELQVGVKATTIAMDYFRTALLSISGLALPALITGIVLLVDHYAQADERIKQVTDSVEESSRKLAEIRYDRQIIQIDKFAVSYEKALDRQFQAYNQYVTFVRRQNDALVASTEIAYKQIEETIKESISKGMDAAKATLKEYDKQLDKTTKALTKFKEEMKDTTAENSERQFRSTLVNKDYFAQVEALTKREIAFRKNAVDQMHKGEEEAASDNINRADKYNKEVVSGLETRLNKEKSALETSNDRIKALQQQQMDQRLSFMQALQRGIKDPLEFVKTARDVQELNQKIAEEKAKAKEAEGNIAKLTAISVEVEKRRAAWAEQYNKELENSIKLLEQRKKAEEQQAADQKKNVEKLSDALKDVEGFKLKDVAAGVDPIAAFKEKADAAIAILKTVDLSQEARLNILRQIEAERLIIIERAINQEREARIRAAQTQIADTRAFADKAFKDQIAAQKKLEESQKQLSTIGPTNVATLRAALEEVRPERFGFMVGSKEATEIINVRRDLKTQLDGITLVLGNFERHPSIEGLKEVQDKITSFYAKLRELTQLPIQRVDQAGNLLLGDGKTSNTIFVEFKKVFDEYVAAQKEFAKANQVAGNARQTLAALKNEVDKLPPGFRETAEEAQNAGDVITTVEGQIQNSLRVSLNQLRAINNEIVTRGNLTRDLPALPVGPGGFRGRLPGFAFGGRGVDVRPALLSPTETVLTSAQTRTFIPFMKAMMPTHMAHGGNVTNVGDVNVTVQGGSNSDTTVREIARGIQREIRRGTIKWRN